MGKAEKSKNWNDEVIRQLIDYIDGHMNKEERQEMVSKLSQDKELQQIESVVRRLRQESQDINWAGIKGSVHALLDTQLKQARPGKRRPDPKQGVTTFDSKLLPLPEGVRPATVDTRRVKYTVGELMVEVSLYPVSPNSYEIIGQLSGYAIEHDITIEIRHARSRFTGHANQFGLFRFPRIPEGSYRIIIKDGRTVIARLDLDI